MVSLRGNFRRTRTGTRVVSLKRAIKGSFGVEATVAIRGLAVCPPVVRCRIDESDGPALISVIYDVVSGGDLCARSALQRFPAEVLVEEMDDDVVGILGLRQVVKDECMP
jgi:hypothetical protein